MNLQDKPPIESPVSLALRSVRLAGAIELAAVGVALSAFNTITKIFNVPLLAVTTSLVATAEGSKKGGRCQKEGDIAK